MSLIETVVVATHLLFAGVWTGSVVFVAAVIAPVAGWGDDPGTRLLEPIANRLSTISRLSAVVLLVTGGHMAASAYTFATLTGGRSGRLVLAMLGLWALLAVLVEVGTARLRRAPADDPSAVDRARRLFVAAAVVAGLLLVDAGLLAAS